MWRSENNFSMNYGDLDMLSGLKAQGLLLLSSSSLSSSSPSRFSWAVLIHSSISGPQQMEPCVPGQQKLHSGTKKPPKGVMFVCVDPVDFRGMPFSASQLLGWKVCIPPDLAQPAHPPSLSLCLSFLFFACLC